MLTLFGHNHSFCDGISRRSFLQVGALGGGLTLANLLRLQAQGSEAPKNKSVILIYLGGGPPHIDMYDMKPEAPSEVRGAFRPIRTRVPGMEISELMPKQAQIADKFSIVRSLQMVGIAHTNLEPMSGFLYKDELSAVGGAPRPSFGSTVSRLRPGNAGLPAYVSLMGGTGGERPAYLGPAYQAFVPKGQGMDNLMLSKDVSLDRLSDRRALLRSFDNVRREIDARGEVAAMDASTARAFDIISSPRTREAFDMTKESQATKDLYGIPARQPRGVSPYTLGSDRLLLARRLVEAGVSVVTLSFGGWDFHVGLNEGLRQQVPVLDQALYGLITDLHNRGLDKDVTVLMWGEFGRGPRVYSEKGQVPGRNHHNQASFAFLAGGGLRMGQVVGATNQHGERPITRAYGPQNVFATVYRTLGIDPSLTLPDLSGRPMHLLEQRDPIAELV